MKTNRNGFTLVEILISLGLFGMASVGLITLLISMLKMYAFNTAQLSLVSDVRKITSEMAQNAEFANYFVVLSDFNTRTVTEGGKTSLAAKTDGQSGNCLLLVYKDPDNNANIRQLMVYYWVKDTNDSTGTIYRYDSGKLSPSVNVNVWELMPATSTEGKHRKICDGVGFSSGLFYNYYNRSVITSCQITQQAIKVQNKNATFTYNFTVSPRG